MQFFTIPNIVCYLRVLLCWLSMWFFLANANELIFFVAILLVMLMDALDGFLARKLNQATEFGAKLDIYSDRLVELSYWLFFALIHRVGLWVFVIFLIRGIVVDYLSFKRKEALGDSWLRSSRFMRFVMGLTKILSFIALILAPDHFLTHIFVYLAVISNILRALPVLFPKTF